MAVVRQVMFAVLLVVAGGLVVAGVSAVSGPLALVVAGVLLGGWSYLVLSS